jgi:hypothetical protein
MAYDFVAASSQYLTTTLATAIDYPFTLAAKFSTANLSSTMLVLSVNNITTVARHLMYLDGSLDKATVASIGSSGPSVEVATTTTYAASTDYAIAAILNANNSRSIYLDGAGKATGTNSPGTQPPAMSAIGIGARFATSWGTFMDGQIAEAAIWNAALTDAEVESLAKGFKPTRIRPQSLVFYAPLIRNLQDTRGALAITNNNSATVAEHPRVY